MNKAEEVKSKLDIVDIISEYINLRPAGSNFRALCPFHNEKSPSFMVSPDKQIYHCFGCGKGGDLISFVMEMEGIDFIEALKVLAPRAGVIIDNKDFSDNSQKNRLIQIMDFSRKYYNYILTSEKGDIKKIKSIKNYLTSRGLSQTVILDWQIGYSLDNYDDLINFLKSKSFKDNEILAAGLSSRSNNGKYFNRFRDRIMFPINDVNGRTVAFTARINPEVKDDKSLGKYINSPQTEIYDKSRILFALDRAKMIIKKEDVVILVEGQMDAISAYEAGFKNVCAVSGTALTVSQLNLIKRYTKNIILAFDQDIAGKKATDRGISEALAMGFNLKIANLTEGQDPDDIIRENPDNFKKALDSSQDIMNYYLTKEFKGLDINDIKNKNLAVHKILTVINKLYNKVEQDFWVKELSQKAKVEEVFLREELQKIPENTSKSYNILEAEEQKSSLVQKGLVSWEDKLLESLLSVLLKNNDYCEYVFNNLGPEFILGKYKEFYNYCSIYYNKSGKIDYQGLLSYFKQEGLDKLEESIKKIGLISDFYWSDEVVPREKIKEDLIKNITEIKKNFLKEKIRLENNNLIEVEKNNDNKGVQDIMKKLQKYNQELQKII